MTSILSNAPALNSQNEPQGAEAAHRQIEWTAVLLVAAVLLFSTTSTLLLALNRGLNLTDEGFYLLSSTNPGSYPHPSSFAFVLQHLPKLLPDPILNSRLCAVITQLSSSLLVCIGFTTWLRATSISKPTLTQVIAIATVSSMASLLFPTVYAFTTGYNELSSFLIFCSAGAIFLALSATQTRSNNQSFGIAAAVACVSGMAVSFSLFTKISSFCAYYPVSIAAIWFLSERFRLRILLFYLAGTAIGIIIFFQNIESWQTWWRIFQATVIDIELHGGGAHGPGTFLSKTAASLIQHSLELLLTLSAGVILLIAAAKLKKRAPQSPVSMTLSVPSLGLLGLIGVWINRAVKNGDLHSSMVYWPAVFVGLAALTCWLTTRFENSLPDQSSRFKIVLGIIFVSILPFLVSFGTDTSLLWHAIGNIAPLYLGLGLLSIIVGNEIGLTWFAPVISAFMLCICTFQFFNGFLLHSNLGVSLAEQNVQLKNPARARNLELDRKLAQFIDKGNSLLVRSGFQPGDPILALYDLPSFVYIEGGRSPMFAEYGESETFTGFNSYFLGHLPKEKWQRLYLIVSNSDGANSIAPGDRQLLHDAGLEFPRDFHLLGTALRPDMSLAGRSPAFFYELKQSMARH